MTLPSRTLGLLRSSHPDATLYHYTSLKGLHGILTSKTVWATAIHYLNDSQEFEHAIDILREIVIPDKKANLSVSGYAEFYENLDGILNQREGTSVCVFSLSRKPDLLSQWRGYCPSSGGYSIGFSSRFFNSNFGRTGGGLFPCEYNIDRQKNILSTLLDEICEIGANPDGSLSLERFRSTFLECLTRVAPFIKHPTFFEEAEWRIILESASLSFRKGRSMLIPYSSFGLKGVPFPSQSINEIWVGPTMHRRLAEDSVKGLLKLQEFSCPVNHSKIPFRQQL